MYFVVLLAYFTIQSLPNKVKGGMDMVGDYITLPPTPILYFNQKILTVIYIALFKLNVMQKALHAKYTRLNI